MDTSELLKKVRRIEIKTKGLSKHVFAGEYHSAFKGRGMTFNEVREYDFGDDIRNIDWNVTARMGKPYIKIFEEERELTVILLVDVSNSQNFGTRNRFKDSLITELSAVLSFSAIQNNDKVGVIFFSDKIEKFIPPKKGKKHILYIIRELLSFKAESKKTDLSVALKYLVNVIKKRSTVFLISDFNDGDFSKALQTATHKHDVVAIKIFDERESTMPDIGLIKFSDAETGEEIWVNTSNELIRAKYEKLNLIKSEKVKEIFKKTGVDNTEINTKEDYIKPLLRLFKNR
jgi:uncharacterized protein (DUF58 family)